jgi:hypothetical protein
MTCVCALSGAPAAAAASTAAYRGGFHPSGSLRFTLGHHDGHRWVTKFVFSQFPLATCDHGPNTETSSLSYEVRVKSGSFKTIGILGHHKHPRSELVLQGTLGRHGRASGTMRVFGSQVPVDDTTQGAHDRCDSGIVNWSAHRR